MKKSTNQIHILLLLLTVILCITGCDAFIAPTNGRENPNDPSNPVPIITDFTISNITEDSVTLSWIPQADTSGSYPSLLILSNSIAAPTNPSDGTSVIDIALSAEEVETTISELDLYSEEYYFSAWTYKEIDGDIQYTGPVSLTTPILISESIEINVDGWVNDSPIENFGTTTLLAGLSGGFHYNSLIRGYIGSELERGFVSVLLTIYVIGSPAVTEEIELRNIVQSWNDATVLYTDTETGGFSESITDGLKTIEPSFSGSITFDVTEVFRNLAAGGSHAGLLVKGPTTASFMLAAKEHATDPAPIYDVVYYLLE